MPFQSCTSLKFSPPPSAAPPPSTRKDFAIFFISLIMNFISWIKWQGTVFHMPFGHLGVLSEDVSIHLFFPLWGVILLLLFCVGLTLSSAQKAFSWFWTHALLLTALRASDEVLGIKPRLAACPTCCTISSFSFPHLLIRLLFYCMLCAWWFYCGHRFYISKMSGFLCQILRSDALDVRFLDVMFYLRCKILYILDVSPLAGVWCAIILSHSVTWL